MQILVSRRARVCAIAFTAVLAWAPASIYATQGDCAQPVTNGSSPTASDCLFILRAAVGSETCDPACICAPKGSLPTTATDALVCLKKAVGQPVMLSCPCQAQAGDDFDDDSKDPAKWGDDETTGNGVLTETGQALQYACSPGTPYDEVFRPWIGSAFPPDSDWEAQIDTINSSLPSQDDQLNSYGLRISNASNTGDEIDAEMYASHYGGPPLRTGFYGYLATGGFYVGDVDTLDLAVNTGAVRVAYKASTKVVTLYYDTDTSNGYTWVSYGSFGIAGSGGSTSNTDWSMGPGDRFDIAVYGFSANMTVSTGTVYGDNFLTSGGVAP